MIRQQGLWRFTVPELPEVETVARTLLPHIRDHIITGATLLRQSSLHSLSMPLARVAGCRIIGTRRRGKLLILDLEAVTDGKPRPSLIVAHLRMTGRLLNKPAAELANKHTRCIFDLQNPNSGQSRLFFDDTRAFGHILAGTPAILAKWPFWRDLGPEPLAMAPAELAPRLLGQRPLKTALMDQKVIAGIGNIYADESLFAAGLNPMRPANSLNEAECATLLGSIQDILRLSISQCGSSIRDYRDADGNAGAFQNSFAVYGRGGEQCKRCGATLQKTRLSGRATVFCPSCQK